MQNIFTLTENGINSLLNMQQINEEINVDIYLQLIQYKILNEKHNLFQCTLKDDANEYDKFILKSKKDLNIYNIIHLIKIKVTITGNKRYINCLIYENLKVKDYVTRLNKIKIEKEEKERKEKEFKEQKEKEDLIRKKNEEVELKRRKIEKDELNNAFLNDELNSGTKLILKNLKHKSKRPKYNFKWEKGNLKWTDIKKKLNNNNDNIIEEEKENNNLDIDKSDDKSQNKNNEIIKLNKNEIEKNNIEINNETENKKKEIDEKEENEDKKEIEDIFKGINIEELFKINKKKPSQSKKLEQEFELIVNISPTNYKKPIYVKCVMKNLITSNKNNAKFLYYIFRDSDGCEIKANTYTKKDISNLDKKISLDGVYIISRYKVKSLTHTNQIDDNYRLILTSYTKIDPMPPDPVFNNIHFHFLKIDELFFFKEKCIVDICGIIYDEGESRYYNMLNCQKYMRNVLIGDTSMKKIILTLYEPYSKDERIILKKGEIIAVKYGQIALTATKIKKINTTNYTLIRNSTGDYEQDILLSKFYQKNQNIDNFLFIYMKENYKYLKDIKSQMEFNSQNKVEQCKITFVTKAYVENFSLDENSLYKSCPLCSKKLIESNNNKYECFLCKKKFDKPKYTYILTLRVRDAEDKAYFKLLGTKANKILEVEPELVKQYLDEGNSKELENIEKKILFNEYIFTVTLSSFVNNRNGNILHNINIDNMEKADGENLKRILKLISDNEDEES